MYDPQPFQWDPAEWTVCGIAAKLEGVFDLPDGREIRARELLSWGPVYTPPPGCATPKAADDE